MRQQQKKVLKIFSQKRSQLSLVLDRLPKKNINSPIYLTESTLSYRGVSVGGSRIYKDLIKSSKIYLYLVSNQFHYLYTIKTITRVTSKSHLTDRVLWEHQVASSNPVAPTQSKPSHTSELPRLAFLLLSLFGSNVPTNRQQIV